MLKKLTLLLATAASVFAMHSAEININEKDLEVAAKFDMGQFNHTVEPNTTFIGVSYLKASDDYSEGEDGNITNVSPYGELSFLMKRQLKESGFFIGIGFKANYTEVEDKVFSSIPLGLEFGYLLPIDLPARIDAEVYFAPESLAFEDANSYLEYRLSLSFELIERGSIVGGFRNIDTNFMINDEKYKVNYNSATYFGFRFDF